MSAKRTYAVVVAKDEKTADDGGHNWMRAYQQIRRAIEAVCEAYESHYEGELPMGGYKTKTEDLRSKNEDPVKIV